MAQNADETYAWKLLGGQLRAELKQLDAADQEINRLQSKKAELAFRISNLENAIVALGGDLEEARKS